MTNLQVLGRRTSNNVQKVLWLLDELQLPHEQKDLGGRFGGNRESGYLAINPNGTVPTLICDEGAIWESNTIIRYLANRFDPHGNWYPAAAFPRSVVERWMDWQAGGLYQTLRPLYVGLVREQRPLSGLEQERRGCEQYLALLEQQLTSHPFIAGDSPSLADIALGSLVHRWFGLGLDAGELPALRGYYESLSQRPAFRKHVVEIPFA